MKKQHIFVFAVVVSGLITVAMPTVQAVEAFEDLPPMEEFETADAEDTESEAAVEAAGPTVVDTDIPVAETDPDVADTLEAEPEESSSLKLLTDYGDEKALEEQERKIQARQLAEEGNIAMKKLLYKFAYESFKKALELDLGNKEYEVALVKARRGYLKDLMKQEKYDVVIGITSEVLQKEPTNSSIEEFYLQAKRNKIGAEAKVEIIAAGKGVVIAIPDKITDEDLVEEAKALMEKDLYIDAKEKLEEANQLNLFNIEVDRLIEECNYRILLAWRDRKLASKLQAMAEVEKRWERGTKRRLKPEEIEGMMHPAISPAKQEIYEKLDMFVEDVSFDGINLETALEWIAGYADISIVIDPRIYTPPPETPAPGEFSSSFEAYPEGPVMDAPPGFDMGPAPGDFGGVPTPGTGLGGVTQPTAAVPYSDVEAADIKLKLNRIPVRELLKYVLLNKNLTFSVEDYAVVIMRPGTVRAEEMVLEEFRLSLGGLNVTPLPSSSLDIGGGGGIGGGGASGGFGGPQSGGGGFGQTGGGMSQFGGTSGLGGVSTTTQTGGAGGASNIEDFLRNSGIQWPAPSFVRYMPSAGVVMVYHTPTNLARVRELINIWNQPPLQVTIEARFVSITLDKANESTFQIRMKEEMRYFKKSDAHLPWTARQRVEVLSEPSNVLRTLESTAIDGVTSDVILNLSGVLTKPEFEILWHALNQTQYTEILSAPRVTTISGHAASIDFVQEIRFPIEWEDPIGLTMGTGTGTVQLPPEFAQSELFFSPPSSWDEREVGIQLAVAPTVAADRKTISMTLIPTVTALIKWTNYGSDLYIFRSPTFEVKRVSTQVHISDQDTLVLGGMISETTTTQRDKVPILGSIPFLGRLFRSENEVSTKHNLIIFVTATLVTPRGTTLQEEQTYTEMISPMTEELPPPMSETMGIEM